jgi:hypothetical protein
MTLLPLELSSQFPHCSISYTAMQQCLSLMHNRVFERLLSAFTGAA